MSAIARNLQQEQMRASLRVYFNVDRENHSEGEQANKALVDAICDKIEEPGQYHRDGSPIDPAEFIYIRRFQLNTETGSLVSGHPESEGAFELYHNDDEGGNRAIHTTEDLVSVSLHTAAWDFTDLSSTYIVDFLELFEDLHSWLEQQLECTTAENKEEMLAYSRESCRTLFLAIGQLDLAARVPIFMEIGKRKLNFPPAHQDLLHDTSALAPAVRTPVAAITAQEERERGSIRMQLMPPSLREQHCQPTHLQMEE